MLTAYDNIPGVVTSSFKPFCSTMLRISEIMISFFDVLVALAKF